MSVQDSLNEVDAHSASAGPIVTALGVIGAGATVYAKTVKGESKCLYKSKEEGFSVYDYKDASIAVFVTADMKAKGVFTILKDNGGFLNKSLYPLGTDKAPAEGHIFTKADPVKMAYITKIIKTDVYKVADFSTIKNRGGQKKYVKPAQLAEDELF